jgi:hypothetical protein
MPIKSSLTFLPMSQQITSAPNTISSFCYDPAKTITRTTTSSFPTVTRCYEHAYPTRDQIRERGKNLSTVTDGETFSDLWMDDLIYATAIHTSNHLHVNRNLDGYGVVACLLIC